MPPSPFRLVFAQAEIQGVEPGDRAFRRAVAEQSIPPQHLGPCLFDSGPVIALDQQHPVGDGIRRAAQRLFLGRRVAGRGL